MKKPLSKVELLGIFFLALIIIIITFGAYLMRNHSSSEENPGHEIKIVAVEEIPVDTKMEQPGRKKSAAKTSKKNRSKKAAVRKSSGKENAHSRNPFEDTIPTAY